MIIEADRENFRLLNFLDKFMVGHKGYIAGGCFKNIFNKEPVKDIDIFFDNIEDLDEAIQYFDGLAYSGSDNTEYIYWYENGNARAYKHVESGIVLELCQKLFNSVENMIANFDFTITKFAYFKVMVNDSDDPLEEGCGHIEYKVLYDDKFFEHLHMKRLVVDDKILFPMSTFERMIRYAKYGYMPCRDAKMRVVNAIRDSRRGDLLANNSLYDGFD